MKFCYVVSVINDMHSLLCYVFQHFSKLLLFSVQIQVERYMAYGDEILHIVTIHYKAYLSQFCDILRRRPLVQSCEVVVMNDLREK